MERYPYIEIDGKKLSLIAPFTYDDRLITGINVIYGSSIIFKTDDGTIVRFDDDSSYINGMIKTSLDRFIAEEFYNISITFNIGDTITTFQGNEVANSYEKLIRGTKDQALQLQFQTKDQLIHKLMDQGRGDKYVNYYQSFINSRELCGTIDAPIFSYPYYSQHPQVSLLTDVIHSYNYKPEYIKHSTSKDISTPLLYLGAEIEVDDGGESREHAKAVLGIINGDDSDREDKMFCVHDGSLYKGIEFVTMPGTLNWHSSLPYKEMFKYLDENGYKAHDTTTCGLHVHINRDFFGEKEYECIGKLMYIVEKFEDEMSVLGRRNCKYSKLIGYNGEKCKELFFKGYKNRDKYNAINLLHEDTIEIRIFKSTLKYETFMHTLEFVSDLAHFVKSHSDEEVESMSWDDLMDTFSDGLREYYLLRKEIEDDKKTKDKEYSSLTFENGSRISFTSEPEYRTSTRSAFTGFRPSRLFIDNVEIGEIRETELTPLEFDAERGLFQRECQCTWNLESVGNAVIQQVIIPNEDKSEKEKLKERVKMLSSEVKRSKNYLEKRKLNKELNSARKELKKLKKNETN